MVAEFLRTLILQRGRGPRLNPLLSTTPTQTDWTFGYYNNGTHLFPQRSSVVALSSIDRFELLNEPLYKLLKGFLGKLCRPTGKGCRVLEMGSVLFLFRMNIACSLTH